jgi:outer membrane protein TolC
MPSFRSKHGLLLSTLLAGAVALTGCKVDQQKEVAQYRKVLDENPLPKLESAPADQEALTLLEAMSLANRHNESLGLSGEDYVQALIAKSRAVSFFLPTVSLQPSFLVADRPNGPIAPGQGGAGSPTAGPFRFTDNTARRFEAPVVGSYDFHPIGVYNLRAAESVIAQRRELLLDLQATVLLNVAQSYYQVLRSERAAAVLRQSLDLQTARLSDVTQQFNNGLATRLSVAQTRAQVDAVRVQLVQAESDARNGRSVLANVLGIPTGRLPHRLADTFPVPAELPPESDWHRRAADHRQDIRAAQAALAASRQGVSAAASQYWPSVGLDVQGFLYREAYADASRWNALLSANIPIFTAGLIEADVRTAWSRLRQAALSESATRRQVIQDVRVAYENFTTANRRIAELTDQVDAADEAYAQSQGAFQNGLAINLDVLTALDQLQSARLQLAAANFDRTVFYLNLLRATGELVPQQSSPATRPAVTVTRAP